LSRDRNDDRPEILGRLRIDVEDQLDEPTAPGWARPVGWLIAAAIVALVVVALVRANPL
jgi:hypothetical protein